MADRRIPRTGKRVLIVCPAKPGSRYGNRVRALRYQSIFKQLGFHPRIVTSLSGDYDLAVVLHAYRSAEVVAVSKSQSPERPVVLVITGTDLYQYGKTAACQTSFALADRIVVAQSTMVDDLPKQHRSKTVSIYQSAVPLSANRPTQPRNLRVVVSGHLRQVKDPFRTAMAVRKLPASSRIVVDHYGSSLHTSMKRKAMAEMQRNARYRWHGEITRGEMRRKLSKAWLMVLSSKMEGGANVLSEAIAARTPILASHIPGSTGLLGQRYKGLFAVGDTRRLRELLIACENDPSFYRSLRAQIGKRAHLVDPKREARAWKKLLANL